MDGEPAQALYCSGAPGAEELTAAQPGSSGSVRVLLFGALREQLGDSVVVPLPVGTVADLWRRVTHQRPHLRERRESVRAARNLSYCDWDTVVAAGDEVAFLPPVSGGAVLDEPSTALYVAVTDQPIDIGRLCAATRTDAAGALASFLGVVRDHHDGRPVLRLDYQAYVPMAQLELGRIAAVIRDRHHLSGLALVHRIGCLEVGEVSLAVVAGSAHRGPALDACRDAVEMIKRDVPVWKREHHPEGANWVDARHLEDAHG